MNTDRELGEKIKKLRLAQKMKLKDVSQKANLSIGYISLIERGASSISLDSLERIANALNVPMQYLLHEPDKTPQFIFCAERLQTAAIPQTPTFYQFLGNTGADYILRSRIVSMLPGHEDFCFHPSEASEGFIYMLEGQLEVRIDAESTMINPGDCVHFAADKKYSFCNPTQWVTKFLYVYAQSGTQAVNDTAAINTGDHDCEQ